ncbi:MAG: PBP1A family penicillin-binding protein [Candidatus Caenarcaniphilales bacterium]|nr:PBP1A family penicillin-binding protein [Candidatus Caenarcaniphilales bacterium]
MLKKLISNKIIIAILLLIIASPFLFKASLPIINKFLGAPSLSILEDYQPIGSIEIYDHENNFVGVLQGKEDRQVVQLEQISDYAKKALLAAEDNQFFRHSGFSFQGFLRALIKNIKAGKIVQGGSTLTQQMVKNLFIKEDERYKRTIKRKIIELLIAFEVENKYDKEKILEIYLNQVYFGNLAYGIERAAQRYFSKHAADLNLLESSYLAALLTAPSYLSANLEKAQVRQQYVLDRMLELGYISKEEYTNADLKALKFNKSKGNFSKFPYFFSYVEHELNKRFTRNQLKTTGLKVYTSLDPDAQREAKKYLNLGVKNAAAGINQGALVSIDVETAQIRALVGGVGNFWDYQYNRATNPHTLGSGFKPFVYLTAFMQGVIDPGSIIKDEPLILDDPSSESMIWSPQNFDLEFHGPITARAALIFSRNIPAIKVAMKTGVKNIIKTAHQAGLKSNMMPILSLALGSQAFAPLEVAGAYSTLARGGVRIEPILIRKIVDINGRTLEQNEPIPHEALSQRHVGQLVEIMKDVVNYGTGAYAKLPGREIAGKTGTADGSRDIWFTGFTPDTVTTVWAGNENNKEVLSRYATGGSTPAWIWREYMTAYYKANPQPANAFLFTNHYKTVKIDPLTGLLATDYTPNPVLQRFIPGTEPKRYAPIPDVAEIKTRDEHKQKNGFFSIKNRKISEEDEKIKMIKKAVESNKPKSKKKKEKDDKDYEVKNQEREKVFSIFDEYE